MEAEAGTPPAALPPKSEWKVYRVNIIQHEVGTIDVLAPNREAAKAAAEEYMEEDENGGPMIDWGADMGDLWRDIGQDTPDELDNGSDPDIEYDPMERYREYCDHADTRNEGGIVTCGSCGATL
jgi:hypothetical protein